MEDNKNEAKEIDLLELFRIIGQGIRNGFLSVLKGVIFLIVFGIKQIHWLLLATILGGFVGYSLYSNSKRFYASDMIIQTNGISTIDMAKYLNNLNILAKENNTDALNISLNLPDTTQSILKSIEAFNYVDVNNDGIGDYIDFKHSFVPKDTIERIDINRIYIQLEVYNINNFSKIRNGILHYVSSNSYFTRLNNIRNTELTELVDIYQKEIIKIDSLQNVDYFKSNNNLGYPNDNRVVFVSENEKQMYYKDKMLLITEKRKHIKELQFASTPITIIKDFLQPSIAENPLMKYIAKFGLLFGVIGYLILLFIHLGLIKKLQNPY